jgi:holo-[acyl-carrier protein] synthase
VLIRTGLDLVDVRTFAERARSPDFLRRAFVPTELRDTRPVHLAGIFAAKEAVFKALDCPARWHGVEILTDVDGRPTAFLAPDLTPWRPVSLDLSISHDGDYAAAVVVTLIEESTPASAPTREQRP